MRIGWAYSNSLQRFKEPITEERLAKYWEEVLETEKEWRRENQSRIPKNLNDVRIALNYLRERTQETSIAQWLPADLEALNENARLKPPHVPSKIEKI